MPVLETVYPDHEAAPPRGDVPSRRLSAADRGPQTELGEPLEREGVQKGPRGDREPRRGLCGPRRLPLPYGRRRRREPLSDGLGLRGRRAAADLSGSARRAREVARGRPGAEAPGMVAEP